MNAFQDPGALATFGGADEGAGAFRSSASRR